MLKYDSLLILSYTCPAADVRVYMREVGTAHSALTFSPLESKNKQTLAYYVNNTENVL
jgi:hypothetical protein